MNVQAYFHDLKRRLAANSQPEFEDPSYEAQRLICDTLDWNATAFLRAAQQDLNQADYERLEQVAAGRLKGQPLSKILGWREFYGRRFIVTQDTLDPRPASEILIDFCLTWLKENHSAQQLCLADLGTGTGCLGLTLSAELPSASLVLSDLSPAALKIAGKNAEKLGLDKRCEFLQSDWFSAFQGQEGRFDLIISNPPYICEAQYHALAPAVRDYDPKLALYGGLDGLEPYRRLSQEAATYLKPQGLLVLEHGFDQRQALCDLYLGKGWRLVATREDYSNMHRMLAFTRG